MTRATQPDEHLLPTRSVSRKPHRVQPSYERTANIETQCLTGDDDGSRRPAVRVDVRRRTRRRRVPPLDRHAPVAVTGNRTRYGRSRVIGGPHLHDSHAHPLESCR